MSVCADRDVPCERCGRCIWWDDTPHPTCNECAAIVPENCGSCAYSNDDDAVVPSLHTYCTNANSFYRAKLMEKSAKCSKHEAKP